MALVATGDLAEAERAAVEAHAARCPRCASILASCRCLAGGLKELADPPPDEAFLAGLRLAGAKAIRRAKRRTAAGRALAVAGALAAGLVAGLVFWQTWLRPGETAPGGATPAHLPPHGPAVQAAVRDLWRHAAVPPLPVSLRNALVVRGQRVYAPVGDGDPSHIVAIHARTGQVRWRSDARSLGYLSADGRRVFCLARGPDGPTELLALDARTGAVQWRYAPPGESQGRSPCRAATVAGDRVCWTAGAAVHLIGAADGRPVWVRPMAGEGPVSAPAADGTDLFVASGSAVYSLAAETGDVLWRRPLGGGVQRLARPLVEAGGGRVFVATGALGRLVALDRAGRTELWAKDLSPVLHLLAGGERLYVRSPQGVLALDAGSGRRLWRWDAQGCGPMTVAEGTVYFVDMADVGRVVAARADDGRQAWEIRGLRSCEPFLLAGGTGFLKSSDGVVRAMALAHTR